MNDVYTCKYPKYETLTLINETFFNLPNIDQVYSKISERLVNGPDYFNTYKTVIGEDQYFISGINLIYSDLETFTNYKNQFIKELMPNIHINPTWFNHYKLLTNNYLYLLFMNYMRWNTTSRLLVYKTTKKTIIFDFERQYWKNRKYLSNPDSDKLFLFDQIKDLYNMSDEEIKKMEETVIYADKMEIKKIEILQDLLNFGIGIKYPEIAGYTIYMKIDENKEYVLINPTKDLLCCCIAKLHSSYFEIFYDYQTYLENFNYTDFREYCVSTNIIDHYNIIINLVSEICKQTFIGDFYTNPKLKTKIFRFSFSDEYKKKYIKYKMKYIQLKSNLK
jgi:hypothetical protein